MAHPSHQQSETPQQQSEVSLKDLILKIGEWWRYLLRKWWIIVLCGILGVALGFAYGAMQKPKYVADLTFILEDGKSSSLGAYAGIASQFGIDLGGGSGSGVLATDNIIAFLKSRLMVEKVLLSPIQPGQKNISLAEFYIEIYHLRDGWTKDPALQNLQFPPNPDRRKFTVKQDSILQTLYQSILRDKLGVARPDKKSSFIAVTCISANELFSKAFTERLVSEATDFYVQTKTKRTKTNVDKLQEKADSLENLLNRKTYSAAASQDLNLNPARRVATVGTELVTRDKMVLQTMYGEVIKNLEISRMAMSQEMPIIQIVDSPILPLKKVKLGKLKGGLIGGFSLGFLAVLVLLLKKLYRSVMD